MLDDNKLSDRRLEAHTSRPLVPDPSRAGFTLLEMLLALSVFSLIIYCLSVTVQLYQQVETTSFQDYHADWQQFVLSMDQHLADLVEVHGIDSETIYYSFTNQHQQRRQGQLRLHNRKIYHYRDGYQAFLYDVTCWQLAWDEYYLYMEVEFDNGQRFRSQWPWPEAVHQAFQEEATDPARVGAAD